MIDFYEKFELINTPGEIIADCNSLTVVNTGTATAVITAAGNYSVPVNAQFLRLQGNPTTGATITNVYKLLLFHSKSS